MQRSPSVTKQRRRTPRAAQHHLADRMQMAGEFARRADRGLRGAGRAAPIASSVDDLAADRPPAATRSWLPTTQIQSRPACRRRERRRDRRRRAASGPPTIVEAVAERDDAARGDSATITLAERGKRGARVVGRQQRAAPRKRRALLEMQVGDDERVLVAAGRARRTRSSAQATPPSAISAVVALGAASGGRPSFVWRGPSRHRLFHQHRFRLRQDLVRRLAEDPLAADLENQRDGERRDAIRAAYG